MKRKSNFAQSQTSNLRLNQDFVPLHGYTEIEITGIKSQTLKEA